MKGQEFYFGPEVLEELRTRQQCPGGDGPEGTNLEVGTSKEVL